MAAIGLSYSVRGLCGGAQTLRLWCVDCEVCGVSKGYTQAFSLAWHVRCSLPTRDWTHVACIARQILNHWATKEVLIWTFYHHIQQINFPVCCLAKFFAFCHKEWLHFYLIKSVTFPSVYQDVVSEEPSYFSITKIFFKIYFWYFHKILNTRYEIDRGVRYEVSSHLHFSFC